MKTSGFGWKTRPDAVRRLPIFTQSGPVSTRFHEAGDGFTITVTEPVYSSDGAVLVPIGATMHGTVESSERSTDPEDPAALTFRFDELRRSTFGGLRPHAVSGRASAGLYWRLLSSGPPGRPRPCEETT